MSGCRRFEGEGLELLEAGEPLGEHFTTCPDCRARLSAYEALRKDLAALGGGEEPPAGWRDRVRREVRETGRTASPSFPHRPRLGRWWPVPALAAAAAIVFAVTVFRPQGPPEPALRASVERGSVAFRGDEAPRPGDTLSLEAEGGRHRRLELRIYRNERELLARCENGSGSGPADLGSGSCFRDGGRLRLTLTLDAVGRYQPVLLFSAEPLPPPAAGLDADVGAVLRAGGRLEMGDEIVVR
jgi:hypothetical protein